jgi:hypothetical protein
MEKNKLQHSIEILPCHIILQNEYCRCVVGMFKFSGFITSKDKNFQAFLFNMNEQKNHNKEKTYQDKIFQS